MEKSEFLNYMMNEDKSMLLKIYDKMLLAERTGQCIFSNEFYPPNLWSKLHNAALKFNIKMDSYGGFEESERRMVAFYTYDLMSFPLKIININNKSKFTTLGHRDYLGALMSLGIKREKMGDLIVSDDSSFIAVCEDVSSYIEDNLISIGRCPCLIEEIFDFENLPKPSFKNIVVISTALRLDCITSALTGLSRSKCMDLVSGGKVLLNYNIEVEKDRLVSENSIVTIRGYGKYRIDSIAGKSSSGRLKLNVRKYE
jgi:RNA-binding protein YlmH